MAERNRLVFLLGVLGPITTLIVSPFTNLDPINPSKLLVVSTIAGSCLGIMLGISSEILKAFNRGTLVLLLCFPAISLIAFAFSESNKMQQLFGVYGRNTGLLSYLALFIVLFATSLVDHDRISERLHVGLAISSVFMLAYCLIQIAGLDPVKWSSFAPFGTLGNVNFSSAFLGLSAVAIGSYFFSKRPSRTLKLALFLHQLVTLFVIEKTGSIQGILVYFLGYWTIFSILIYLSRSITWFLSWIGISTIAFGVAFAGFLDKGPLSTLLYQETNTFRFDYWHAGLEMIQDSPVLGHGFDSYGDLYTQDRGLISALRTSLGRTSNSAHNIFIDVGVSGGMLLLLALIAIFGLASVRSISYIRYLRREKRKDFIFLGLFGFWVAYMAQALISINQIGIGVWAWLITGIMLGVSQKKVTISENLRNEKMNGRTPHRAKNSSNKSMGPVAAIFGLLFTTLGFSGGYVPVAADAAFRSGSDHRSLNEMIDASNSFGANSFIISKTVDIALQNNYPDQALQLTEKLITEFPSDSYAWKIRAKLGNVSESERIRALTKILELDPFFACATPTPMENFKKWIFALPPEKQYELAYWWKLIGNTANAKNFNFSSVDQEALAQKLNSLC